MGTTYKKCSICGFSLPETSGGDAVSDKHYDIEHDKHIHACRTFQVNNGLIKEEEIGNCGDCRHSWRASNTGSLLCSVEAEMLPWKEEESMEEIPCSLTHRGKGEKTCGDYERK